MAIAQSKLTMQGQISVPAQIRRKLGVGPGSVLEWVEADGNIVVRRSSRYSSGEIHRALFPSAPKARTLAEMKAGIQRDIKRRHAR
jgi:antitoxin PrlF